MTLEEVVVRLSERAKAMNEIIERSYKMLEQMKKRIYSEQEKKLKLENKQLQDEVEIWKSKLIDLETKHGLKQIPLPTNKVEIEPVSVITPVQSSSNVPVVSQVKDESPPKHDKNDKPGKPKKVEKKTPKPKADGDGDARLVDVSRLDFRIGIIQTVSKHPDADSLYVEQIDLGEDKLRTVVSGLVKFVPLEEMQNRWVVVLCNLKPAKMRGILSEAMVMCASTPEKVEILNPPSGCVPGDRVSFEGYPGEPDTLLNPKKKIFEQVAPDLKTDANCVATYKGVPFVVKDKGIIKASTLANVNIK
ncbi:aminoacyl tRNA synthase complex-interacting multifunctional protein 1-like [Centruroides sculpturatus]|uniref:aminoacyl tRNA synthase complex-interacting multifunctional protein 1-like n=1 Tax=Centruroides sculpturatus TaxID=218467 RepID=UPI000C6E73DE|nr:aminoacyl tRNA synthase complex-interacting multifunctional protein 1-like [Centruroides sculpturatus]